MKIEFNAGVEVPVDTVADLRAIAKDDDTFRTADGDLILCCDSTEGMELLMVGEGIGYCLLANDDNFEPEELPLLRLVEGTRVLITF